MELSTYLERRLQAVTPISCDLPILGGRIDTEANDSFPALARLQMDLLTRALACDLTRVASIQLSLASVRFSTTGLA